MKYINKFKKKPLIILFSSAAVYEIIVLSLKKLNQFHLMENIN